MTERHFQPSPYLAAIEQALTVGSAWNEGSGATRNTPVSAPAMETLERLRAGEDPTAGMFTIRELLLDLIEQHPALKVVVLPQVHAVGATGSCSDA